MVGVLARDLLMVSMLLLLRPTKLVKRTEVLGAIVLRILDVGSVSAFFRMALGL